MSRVGRFFHQTLSCPGVTLISIFLADTKRRETIVLPLIGVNFCVKIIFKLLSYAICFGFIIGFIMDVTDVASGGDYRESPYGKSNPLISLISFCSSQIGFFMAVCAALFLVVKRRRILKCADSLNSLVVTFGLDKPKARTDSSVYESFPNLWKIQVYFYLVLILTVIRFCMAIGVPSFASSFFAPNTYAMIMTYGGVEQLYAHLTMLLSIWFYYPVNTLFTYMAAFLVECVDAFNRENLAILESLKKVDSELNGGTQVDFVERLRSMRNHHEKISQVFDDLEETFSLKILLDVTGNVAVVLSAIAWFSIWAADPASSSWISFARHFLAAVIYLLTVWVVGNQPVTLYIQHLRSMELLDKVIFQRQITNTMKPVREELSFTIALLERFKSRGMNFSAGGVVDLSPFAISTLVACITGFTAFVIDRAENFRSMLRESSNALAISTGNSTAI